MLNGAFCEYCNGKRCTVCRKKALTDETCICKLCAEPT